MTEKDSTAVVAGAIDPENKLGVTAGDLEAIGNPHGEGQIVFVPTTRFHGVRRPIVWLVIDDEAFTLNSPSKLVTPTLLWPREAKVGVWQRTGLDPYQAMAAIESVWIDFEAT